MSRPEYKNSVASRLRAACLASGAAGVNADECVESIPDLCHRTARHALSNACALGQVFSGGHRLRIRYFATADFAKAFHALNSPAALRLSESPGNLWPPEHIAILETEYPSHGAAHVAKLVGRTASTVQRKAAYMGIKCLVDVRWLDKPRKAPKPQRQAIAKEPTRFNPATQKKAAGPALLDKPADTSRARKVVAARVPGRFEVPSDYRGMFSLAGIGRDAMTGRAWA